MTHKNRKKGQNFHVLKGWMFSLGFSCSMNVLYGGLGISKLQFLIKKIKIKFLVLNFFQFQIINPWIRIRDPDPGSGIRIRNQKKCWIRIRIRINADSKPCTYHTGTGQQIWPCYRQKHSERNDFLKSNQNSSIRPEKNSTYSRSSVTVKTC